MLGSFNTQQTQAKSTQRVRGHHGKEPEDRKTSIENPDIIRGSGNYARRSDGTDSSKSKMGPTIDEEGSPMLPQKKLATRKRKIVSYAEDASDAADPVELDPDADFSPSARPTKSVRCFKSRTGSV
jgi:hypothetical protein